MNFNDIFENALELERGAKDLYEIGDKLQECLDLEFEWGAECKRVLLYYPLGGTSIVETDSAHHLKSETNNFYENLIGYLRKINFMNFWMSLQSINDKKFNSIVDMDNFQNNIKLSYETIHRFINTKLQENEFKDEYEKIIKAIKNIIDYKDIIKEKIDTIKNIHTDLNQGIEDSQCKIRLLNQDNSLDNTIQSLEMIKKLYSIICLLMHVDEKEYPIRYSRVESGSLLTELLGHADVLTAVGGVIAFGYKVFNDHFSKKAKQENEIRAAKIRGGLIKEIKAIREVKLDLIEQQEELAEMEEAILKMYKNSSYIEINKSRYGEREIDKELVTKYIEEGNLDILDQNDINKSE